MNKDSLYYYMAKKVSFNTDHFIDFLDGLFSCFEKDGLTDIKLVMDNVRFHHGDSIIRSIEESGHKVLFLPA